MSYDGSIREELAGYFEAKEPGRRERADAWAMAIGLQKVDGLTPSRYLVSLAKQHIEGRISQKDVHRLLQEYYEAKDERREVRPEEEEPDKSRYQKTVDRLLELIAKNPQMTQAEMMAALGKVRSTVRIYRKNTCIVPPSPRWPRQGRILGGRLVHGLTRIFMNYGE